MRGDNYQTKSEKRFFMVVKKAHLINDNAPQWLELIHDTRSHQIPTSNQKVKFKQ